MVSSSSTMPSNQMSFTLQAKTGVSYWVVNFAHYDSTGKLLSISSSKVSQDSSGGAINFDFNGVNEPVKPTDSVKITAQGYSSSDQVFAQSGLLSVAASSQAPTSSLNLVLASLSSSGAITGLPSKPPTDGSTFIVLTGAVTDNNISSYSLSALTTALSSAQLTPYADHVVAGSLSGTLKPAGLGNYGLNLSVPINGKNIPVGNVGDGLGPWTPLGIQIAPSATASTTPTNINVRVSTDGGTTYSTVDNINLVSGKQKNLPIWNWNLWQNPADGVHTLKVYFTDNSGKAVTNLQIATLPATGGVLTASNWVNAAGTATTATSVYLATVAQLQSMGSSNTNYLSNPPANSLFIVQDTLEHIQAAGVSLYSLNASGKLIGAEVMNGFDGISGMSSGGLAPVTITDSAGHNGYIRVFQSPMNNNYSGAVLNHSVLAVTATTTAITIDSGAPMTVSTDSSLRGLTLDSSVLNSLSSGSHTIKVTGGQIGVVPAGGGLPSSYAQSLSIWVGKATELPTSMANITANTLYIINDTAANLVGLDGYASFTTGVINNLASSGYLAYASTTDMTWAQVAALQQSNNNIPIANINNVKIIDTVHTVEHNFWSPNNGQSIGIQDTAANLLNPRFAQQASDIASGNNNQDTYNSVFTAFKNHEIHWADNLATVSKSANLTNMAAVYHDNASLAEVSISDTVANFAQLKSAATTLVSFANTNASGHLTVDIQDNVGAIQSLLSSTTASAIAGVLKNTVFSSVTSPLGARVEINDTVANLASGISTASKWASLQASEKTLFSGFNNFGLDIRVTDTVANIDGFIRNSSYNYLSSNVAGYNVVDTASNITTSIQNSN